MTHEIKLHTTKGRILWLNTEHVTMGIALDYGIRILHLSSPGCDNLLYEQPEDLSDGLTTPDGWRIYGGHRYWAAPESEKSYYPDNAPIDYKLTEDGVILTQLPDPWIGLEKQIKIAFSENGSVLLTHSIRNVTDQEISCASWGVTTFSGGCKAEVMFDGGAPGSYNPQRQVSLWGNSALTDERIRFAQDRIYATHLPKETSFKIGIYSCSGTASLTNKGQCFSLCFEADPNGTYPDGGCNFELYLDKNVLELEPLGQLRTLAPNETASHWERWHVSKL